MPLKVSHGIGAWIKDFQKSDAPQFKGKSDKERRDQAIAAYLSAKRAQKESNEEIPFSGPYKKKPSVIPGKYGSGPSTAKHLAKTGLKQVQQKPKKVKEEVENVHELSKKTLGSYIKQAAGGIDNSVASKFLDVGAQHARGEHDAAGKSAEKGAKRIRGIRQATNKLVAKNEQASIDIGEETTFEVEVDGLPTMYIKAKSQGEVKANLRKIVKQPSLIQNVERITDAEVKRVFRSKAQGRDEEETQESYKTFSSLRGRK